VCHAWYWVANWVCQAWFWVAKWICLFWFWVAKWVCISWAVIIHLICSGDAGPVFLLTDGSVLLNENASGYGTHRWWRLAPDTNGSYAAGTWIRMADANVGRKYFAAGVLADGRLIVCGGEYSDASGSNQTDRTTSAEIYDPVANAWTVLSAPPGATQIGDAPCAVLADGRFLVGEIDNTNTFFFTPGVDTWAAGPAKQTSPAEESWVLMPEGTVLAPQAASAPSAEKFDPATNAWFGANQLSATIFEVSSAEVGPGILLTDGRAFFVGANSGRTALYTAGANATAAGTWAAGPNIPNRPGDSRAQGSKDGPGALLPGGKVLFAAAPLDGKLNSYLTPCSFYEFDGTSLVQVTDPPNADCATYFGRLLPLPSGEVLWCREDDDGIYLYLNTEPPNKGWRPVITNAPTVLVPGTTINVSGQQFNGLSQAQGYGDDYSAATNYPIVRIRHRQSGHIRYCHTSNHTTQVGGATVTSMGVATGAAIITTHVDLPSDLELGASDLVVVANGIPSDVLAVTVTTRDRDG
jgi:Kelch motif.